MAQMSGIRNCNSQRGETKEAPTLMFYLWRMFQRRGEFSTVPGGCRIFQLYLVHELRNMEAERMPYLLHNAEDYKALQELFGDSGVRTMSPRECGPDDWFLLRPFFF